MAVPLPFTGCASFNLLANWFDEDGAGGGWVRSSEIFLMDFSSDGFRRNLKGQANQVRKRRERNELKILHCYHSDRS